MLIHLWIVYGYFHLTEAGLNSCDRAVWSAKCKEFTIWPFEEEKGDTFQDLDWGHWEKMDLVLYY